MGVDSRGVYRVIHFGPSKNIESYIQETGRGGRDGKQTVAHIIYQGLLFNHVERDIKQYVKSEECRRKTLMCQFENCKHVNCPDPKHLCCDNCAKKCYCNSNECRKLTMFPGCANQTGKIHPVPIVQESFPCNKKEPCFQSCHLTIGSLYVNSLANHLVVSFQL